MALFGKNKSAKHSIIEVIKYDGPNDILVWKFPNEDFNTNIEGLHCLGDSSGWTRGLMMASVMGVLMGRKLTPEN